MKMKEKLNLIKEERKPELIRFASAFVVTLILSGMTDPDRVTKLDHVSQASILIFGILFLLSFIILTLINWNVQDFGRDLFILLMALCIYGFQLCFISQNVYVALGYLLFLAVFIRHLFIHCPTGIPGIKLSRFTLKVLVAGIVLLWLLFVISLTIIHYLNLGMPCYDMGIFSQMFYRMKTTLLPDTTCERAQLLSHFKVHMSPAFYIFLPFYFVFPSPITLLVLQALTVASGVIPLYLICKKYHINYIATAAVMIAYILYPANAGGCFYDFHENIMLAPFLLWLLYFLETKRKAGIISFCILTLLVKEDAAIYVACVGLYTALGRKEYKKGAAIFGSSLVYFFVAIFYLQHFGDGAMLGRYSNYMSENGGLISMVCNLIKSPAYLFTQVFTQEKFEFLLLMIIPILGLVFLDKKKSDFILLIPFLVINLMSSNGYQSSIYYQYTFGSTALLFFVTVRVIAGMSKQVQKKIAVYMVLASTLLFTAALGSKTDYLTYYQMDKAVKTPMKEAMSKIPEDKSVRATTFMVPYLSQRMEIYKYQSVDIDTDYIVMDLLSEENKNFYKNDLDGLLKKGYKKVYYQENALLILKK